MTHQPPTRSVHPLLLVAFALVGGAAAAAVAWTLWQDWDVRRREAPLRALMGNRTFEALAAGERTAQHYMGDRLLAPNFRLRDQHGKTWELSKLRGKLVVLNFWSVTCPPCVEEMPSLIDLGKRTQSWGDVQIVTLTIDRNWSTVRSVLPSKVPFPVLFDPERRIVNGRYGTRLFPETWFIDKEGVIRLRLDGPFDWNSPLLLDTLRLYR